MTSLISIGLGMMVTILIIGVAISCVVLKHMEK